MKDLGIIILAGGKSLRMGEDKGLMTLYGKSMVEYVLDEVRTLSDDIIIVANNSNYGQFGYPVYQDKIRGKGPLAGMHEGLEQSAHDINIILSCDVPYIKASLLKFMYDKHENQDAVISVHQDRLHPLIGLYRKSCIPVFKNQIDKNILKISDSFDNLDVKYLNTDQFDEQMFRNINSKRDL